MFVDKLSNKHPLVIYPFRQHKSEWEYDIYLCKMGKKILVALCTVITACVLRAQLPENHPNNKCWGTSTLLFLQGSSSARFFFPDKEGRVPVLFRLASENCYSSLKVPYSAYGNIGSASLTREELLEFSANKCVLQLDVCGRLNSPRPLMDTVKVITGADRLHRGLQEGLPLNIKGQNVIVGIVDIGFQTDNPNFFNADGSAYRVKRFWNQDNKGGTPPSGYVYGSEFSNASAIKNEHNDDGTHGTHVAGISGGSGFTTPSLKYAGIAPESDLVFVAIKYANDTLQGSALGDLKVANPNILDAYKYIFDYAQSQQKPAVCNLSWGMHAGPHDGNSLFDMAVENLTGAGKIVVGANGNDGGNEMHVLFDNAADTSFTFPYDRSRGDYVRENVYVDFWGEANKPMQLSCSVFDTLGNLLFSTPYYSSANTLSIQKYFSKGTDSLKFILMGQASFANNQKPNFLVIAETNNAKKLRIRLGMISSGKVHGWNSGQAYRWTGGSFTNNAKGSNMSANPKYKKGDEFYSMGENGGTGRATISMGANIARNHWNDFKGIYHAQSWLNAGEMAGFSSRGPTVDGRIKPDLSAPGQLVASSVNRRQYPGWFDEYTVQRSVFGGDTQMYTLLSGTSMASPVGCGVVALLLQADPTLNPDRVKKYLYSTAIRDQFTGPDSNVYYGYGKINAFDAVKNAYYNNKANLTGIGPGSVVIYPNPASGNINFTADQQFQEPITLSFYSTDGKQLASKRFAPSNHKTFTFEIPQQTTNGLYLINISTPRWSMNQKIVVQR